MAHSIYLGMFAERKIQKASGTSAGRNRRLAETWRRNDGNSGRTGLERRLIGMQSRQSLVGKRFGLDPTGALAEGLWGSDLCLAFADNLILIHGMTIIYRQGLDNVFFRKTKTVSMETFDGGRAKLKDNVLICL